MTVGQLIRQLEKYDRRAEVEIKLVVPIVNLATDQEVHETYVSQASQVTSSRNFRNQTIVQVTNEG